MPRTADVVIVVFVVGVGVVGVGVGVCVITLSRNCPAKWSNQKRNIFISGPKFDLNDNEEKKTSSCDLRNSNFVPSLK